MKNRSFWVKFMQIKFYVAMIFVGILFSVISGLIVFLPKAESIETEAEVVEILKYYDDINDNTTYEARVKYVVDGTEYVAVVGSSNKTKVGDTMKIKYNVENPAEASNVGGEFIVYIFFAVGVILVIVGVVMTVKTIKKKESDVFGYTGDNKDVNPLEIEKVQNNDESTEEYYFHFYGKMNQSFIMETPQRVAMYKADCEKVGVFKPSKYRFTDCRTGLWKESTVSHTLTKSYGNGNNGFSYSVPTYSAFKIDGVNNWEYLSKMGYSLDVHISGIKLNFDVLKYGIKVAEMESAGVNIISDDKKYKLGNTLPGNGLYKVRCKDSDIEGVFMACFMASRVEFF